LTAFSLRAATASASHTHQHKKTRQYSARIQCTRACTPQRHWCIMIQTRLTRQHIPLGDEEGMNACGCSTRIVGDAAGNRFSLGEHLRACFEHACARWLLKFTVGFLSLQRKTGVNNLHETHAPVHAAAHALSDADAEVDAHVCSHARTGTTPTVSRNAIPACRSSAGIESSMLRSTSSTAALQRHMSLDRRPQC
jgi:hypothetical protein